MKNVSLPESNDDHVDFDYQEEKNHFEKLFLVLDKALGGKAFGSKNTRSDGITDSFRIYHFESIPLAISHIIDKVNPDDDNHISLIRQALTEIKFDPDFVKLTTGGGKNTKNMLEERIAYVSNYLEGIDFG